jgi:hypothetical protein
MDTAILSASAGLIGSLIGGVSTFAASWLTQGRMLRTQTIVQHAMQRQALYSDFIVEASHRVLSFAGKCEYRFLDLCLGEIFDPFQLNMRQIGQFVG